MRIIAPIFLFLAPSWEWVIPGMVLNAVASLYSPAFNAIIAESLPSERRGAAFGAYKFTTSLPSIFMPVVSGYYLDVMGIGQGVRVGLMLFTVAAAVATLVRQVYLTETLEDKQDEGDRVSLGEELKGMLRTFRVQPRTIWAMLLVSVISSFSMRMTWAFLAPYAYDQVGLSTTQYGLLQSVAMAVSVPLYLGVA